MTASFFKAFCFRKLCLTGIALLALCSPAFAQENEEEDEAGMDWATCYIIVGMCVAAGVAAVGVTSNRLIQESRLKEQAETAERNKAG